MVRITCYWCGEDASLTKDGEMYYLLYEKPICAKCHDHHYWLKLMFGSGLRVDRQQPVFQLPLFT